MGKFRPGGSDSGCGAVNAPHIKTGKDNDATARKGRESGHYQGGRPSVMAERMREMVVGSEWGLEGCDGGVDEGDGGGVGVGMRGGAAGGRVEFGGASGGEDGCGIAGIDA